MADESKLHVVNGVSTPIDYQGPGDPRWDNPQLMVKNSVIGLITALPAGIGLAMGDEPARLDEVRDVYHLQPHQTFLTNEKEDRVWLVNAIFRRPCPEGSLLGSLPASLAITPQEMEVLGPWLMLKGDEVCDEGKNVLDDRPQDGVDHVYRTSFDWNSLDDVKGLSQLLDHLDRVKRGERQNPQNLPTGIDAGRLAAIRAIVTQRVEEFEASSFKKPTMMEELKTSTISGVGFGVGTTVIVGPPVAVGFWAGRKAILSFLAKRAAAAGGAALVDGPVPAGDIVGGGILLYSVGELIWNYDEVVNAPEEGT